MSESIRGQQQIDAAEREAKAAKGPHSPLSIRDLEEEEYSYYGAILMGEAWYVRWSLGRLLRTTAIVAGLSIEELMIEVQAAAQRNAHKGDWHRGSLVSLFEKLDEEVREFAEALEKEEAGDVGWTATMIADHGMMLELGEDVA